MLATWRPSRRQDADLLEGEEYSQGKGGVGAPVGARFGSLRL